MNTTELAQQFARELINGSIMFSWHGWVLAALMSSVIGATVAFFGARLRKEAELKAMNANFDMALDQSEAIKRMQSQIDSTIGRADLLHREGNLIRRQKLEELMNAVDETMQWVDEVHTKAYSRNVLAIDESPTRRVRTLVGPYHPSLDV